MNLRTTVMLLTAFLVTFTWGRCGHCQQATAATGGRYANPDLLLEPKSLARPRVAAEFVILDARPEAEYLESHVPGALRVDHDAWKAAYKEGQDPKGWSETIRKLGIKADSNVVVYDDKGMKDAARIWWILRFWGVEKARLLNGGWKGWVAAGLPTTQGKPPAVDESTFEAKPHNERLATMEQMLRMLRGGNIQVVDARSMDEYCGIDLRDNKRGGAIPGAKHLEWSDLIDQETNRFKSPAEISKLFKQAGIDLSKPTASHCNGGGRAAVMDFGLQLMGARNVRNYYRGWGEWGNAENTPIEVPDKK